MLRILKTLLHYKLIETFAALYENVTCNIMNVENDIRKNANLFSVIHVLNEV